MKTLKSIFKKRLEARLLESDIIQSAPCRSPTPFTKVAQGEEPRNRIDPFTISLGAVIIYNISSNNWKTGVDAVALVNRF